LPCFTAPAAMVENVSTARRKPLIRQTIPIEELTLLSWSLATLFHPARPE